MAVTWIVFAAFIFIVTGKINSEGPPKVTGSYKASGEIAETLEDESKMMIQLAFEESYDADTQNAAFRVWVMGKDATFVENYETNQTFRYDETGCNLMTVSEWIKTGSPPSLLSYEDTKGIVRFSLKQLFSLDNKYLKEDNVSDIFRGIPARKWAYEIKGQEPSRQSQQRIVSIYAYWSEPEWNTTSDWESTPLGFVVSKMQFIRGKAGVKLHEQFINVFGFVPKAIDYKLFEPVQGLICKGKKKTIPFPNVNNIKAIRMHSEVIFPEYQEIKYVDTWFDPLNKIIRNDLERIKDEVPKTGRKCCERKYESEMILGKSGIVFQLAHFKGLASCSAYPIKEYDMDIQDIFPFKTDIKDWSVGKLFGVNDTEYIYIGKTSKRDIPCHLFQGVRKDWPTTEAQVESLWEWCFSTNLTATDKNAAVFQNGEYGLINLQITTLKSGTPADYPPKFRIFHHFYDVNLIEPSLTDASNFDIGHCFDDTEKRHLQFVVDWAITEDSIDLIENATSDVGFLEKWKTAIYMYSSLDPNLLRVSGVRSTVIDKQLLLKFTILSAHKTLPDNIKRKQISAEAAEKNLREKINSRAVSISYTPSKRAKAVKIGVVPNTLAFQINTTFIPHIVPPPTQQPTTTTEKIIFTLITDIDEGRPTTSTLHQKNLHKAGTVATVSIAMLLVGITIGTTGIFIKFNGLPACLKFGRT